MNTVISNQIPATSGINDETLPELRKSGRPVPMKQIRSRKVGLLAMGMCLALLAGGCATTRTIDPESGVHYDTPATIFQTKKKSSMYLAPV